MKKLKTLFTTICMLLMLTACCTHEEDLVCCVSPPFESSMYEPVYTSRAIMESSVGVKSVQGIKESGKIYIKGDLLFINDVRKGFHVYDNSDPSSPTALHFIEVLGATDLSVRNNMLYINQATDLIALRYNRNEQTLELTKRIKNVFPEMLSPEGWSAYETPADSVIINWTAKTIND